MKIRTICAIATALVLAASIAAPFATAQTTAVRANVPFDFYAAGKLFPAGTYTLWQINPETLQLRDERGRAVFIPAGRNNARPEDQSWVVFHQYGKVSFLAGAYWSGSSVSLKVPASRAEQEVAKSAGLNPITIAAK